MEGQRRDCSSSWVLQLHLALLDIFQVVDDDSAQTCADRDGTSVQAEGDRGHELASRESHLLLGALVAGAVLVDVDLLDLFANGDVVEVDPVVEAARSEQQVVDLRERNS